MNQKDIADRIMVYLEDKYRSTGWPFIHLKDISSYFYQIDILPALNDLRMKGLIRKRENANGILVELIVNEEY